MPVPRMALTPRPDEISNRSADSTNRFGTGPIELIEPITIYLTVDGSVIPMRIFESDSIASVKLRIQASKGFFVKKQKLVFEGREMARNDTCVRDYGVSDGKMLHLVLRVSDLQAITVRTVCGKELGIRVQRSRSVGYVKQQIARKEGGFLDLEGQQLVCDGKELEDRILINDIRKISGAAIHLLVRSSVKVRAKPIQKDVEVSIERSDHFFDREDLVKEFERSRFLIADTKTTQSDFFLEPVVVTYVKSSPVIEELLDTTRRGLEKGNKPIRSSEGTGGTYFMQDSSGLNYVSVFKPSDEEPMAVNNPRDLGSSLDGEGLKKGTRVGEGAVREVAAYILDHPRNGPRRSHEEKGFSGVPPTIMIKCLHREFNNPKGFVFCPKNAKVGSLQMYVKNDGSCEEMGPKDFSVDDVHKISVLDIRLANADRHAGNILIQKDGKGGRVALVPIDHGYCLPENFEDCTFEWLNWPQSHEPYSAESVDYIKSLDADHDIELLRLHGWDLPRECARNLRVSTMLLKKGAERGLTPFDIGSIMCRETLNGESAIERIVREAETSETAFLESVSSIMDRHLDGLSMKRLVK